MHGARRSRVALLAGAAVLLLLAAASAALGSPGAGRTGAGARQLDTRVHQALLDLYSLDTRLHSAQSRLSWLEGTASRARRQGAALREELAADRAALKVAQRGLALRLRTLYEQGTVDPVAIVLGSESLGTALQRLDGLRREAETSRQVVAVTTAARRRLLHTRLRLGATVRRLASSLAAAHSAERGLVAAAAAKVSYVASLRSRLRQAQVQAVVVTAGAAQQKTERLQRARSQAPTPPPPPAGGRTLVVSATCYDLPGRTATGMPVGWGVVAVDPSVIPLGTRMYVPGYGEGVAADVGSGIRGAMIDLWFPTLARCAAWGRRTVTITLR